MTSKESLEELKRINSWRNNGNGDIWLETMIIQPIEKDLEVLEILKHLIKLKHNTIKNKWVKTRSMGYIESARFEYESEEYKKIKEWLEK